MSTPLRNDPVDDFDLDDPALSTDFERAVDHLVRKCPVAYSTRSGYWMVSKYDDVRACAEDWPTFSSAQGIRPNRRPDDPLHVPIEFDPPERTRWRSAMFSFFTKEAITHHRAGIEAIADALIDGFADQGSCDLAVEYANELPGIAFFNEVLGVPSHDTAYLSGLMHTANYGTPEQTAQAWADMGTYVDSYLRVRSGEPARGDLIDAVLGAEFEDAPISWHDRVSAVSLLISGGPDTTAHVLSGALWHLGTNPDAQQLLRDDPSRIPRAVEEYLRFFATAFAIGRMTTRSVEIRGRTVPAGDMVMLGYAAASRDPDVFDRPDQCDIDRASNRHLAFGFGPHRCIGLHLARLELVVALERILARLSEFDVMPDVPIRSPTRMLRAIENLPMTMTPAPAEAGSRT